MREEIQQSINVGERNISLKEVIHSFKSGFKYLLTKWIFIFFAVFIGGVAGYLYAKNKKPIYTATTTFVLEDERAAGGLGNLASIASMAGVDLAGNGGGIFQGDNILALYQSRNMLEKTLLSTVIINNEKQLLIDRYIEGNQLKKGWVERPDLLRLKFTPDSIENGFPILKENRLRDSVIGTIVVALNKKSLIVTRPDKKLSTIQVDVKTVDELFSKAFNDELVKNVNDFYINTKTQKSLKNLSILQLKTDSVRAVMNGAIYTSAAATDATPNLNPTRQLQRIVPTQRAQFSAETNKAILSTLVQNLEMTKISLLKETPLIQLVDKPVLPLQVDNFGRLKGLVIGAFLLVLLTILSILAHKFLKNY